MSSIEFFVAGDPKGQPRPKAFARGKHAAVYDPGTADGWKLLVRAEADKVKPAAPFDGPVRVSLIFNHRRPASHYSRRAGVLSVKPAAPVFHTAKPDSDNLAKAVLDALTNLGTYWRDDSQVARLDVQKRYTAGAPGCMCVISELGE